MAGSTIRRSTDESASIKRLPWRTKKNASIPVLQTKRAGLDNVSSDAICYGLLMSGVGYCLGRSTCDRVFSFPGPGHSAQCGRRPP